MIAPRVLAAAAVVGGAIGLALALEAGVAPGRGMVGPTVLAGVLLGVAIVAVPKQGPASRLLLAAVVAAVVGAFAAAVVAGG